MADITKYYNVRFANRIDTPGKWAAINPTLEPGELAFVGSEGNYIMVLGDEHRTPIGEIIANEAAHQTHIFYPGSKGGGGGGSSYILPIASDAELGGIKVQNKFYSGLSIDEYGNLSNALISTYSAEKQRFVIEALHVNDLTYNRQETNLSMTGDEIIIRLDSPRPLETYAGIRVKHTKEGNLDGFLGIDNQNRIAIIVDGMMVSGSVVNGTGTGYLTIPENSPVAYLTEFTPLTITDSSKQYSYTPDRGVTLGDNVVDNIIVTPPTLQVNGQTVPYNEEQRLLNIQLDGGLTPETAAKLKEFDNYIEIINRLNTTTINVAEGDTHIDATINDQTLSVQHKNINIVRSPKVNNYKITTSTDVSLVSADVITGIDVDEKGHVTGITTTTFTWSL